MTRVCVCVIDLLSINCIFRYNLCHLSVDMCVCFFFCLFEIAICYHFFIVLSSVMSIFLHLSSILLLLIVVSVVSFQCSLLSYLLVLFNLRVPSVLPKQHFSHQIWAFFLERLPGFFRKILSYCF